MSQASQLIFSPNFSHLVAMGLVPGWRRFRKFGMNNAVASGTEEMWPPGTLRTLPTSAAVAATSSDSAEDDPDEATPPGTGAWTVTIDGLDSAYKEVSETITMAGTGTVNTTQTFIRINRAFCVTAGSNGINVGNISISVGGNLQAYIEAGEGQTHQTGFCVPANHYWLVDNYHVNIGRMSGNVDLSIQAQIRLDATDASWRSISDIYLADGSHHDNFASVTVLPPKTDTRQLIVTTGATQAVGIIDGYLVRDNNYTLLQ